MNSATTVEDKDWEVLAIEDAECVPAAFQPAPGQNSRHSHDQSKKPRKHKKQHTERNSNKKVKQSHLSHSNPQALTGIVVPPGPPSHQHLAPVSMILRHIIRRPFPLDAQLSKRPLEVPSKGRLVRCGRPEGEIRRCDSISNI